MTLHCQIYSRVCVLSHENKSLRKVMYRLNEGDPIKLLACVWHPISTLPSWLLLLRIDTQALKVTHPSNTCLPNVCHVPGTMLGTAGAAMEKSPRVQGACSPQSVCNPIQDCLHPKDEPTLTAGGTTGFLLWSQDTFFQKSSAEEKVWEKKYCKMLIMIAFGWQDDG